MYKPQQEQEPRAFLVGLDIFADRAGLDIEASLAELAMLADTAGLHVVGQTYQRLKHPHPATFIGSGKVEEVREWVEELGARIVLFDDELSPRHQRELEIVFGEDIRVIDRTELILDIFAQHADTREGTLQVSLAQYEYRLPRLTRQWTHLARQAGGGTARGGAGGVGLRGPGETQIETDRREIRRQISHIKKELEAVREHRARHRLRRQQAGIPVVALVGYTNAGKSTLLNQLSDSDVYVADQLFATLDPTTRRVSLPSGREILFTDTVGFIQKLPHGLVAAFRATLEEIAEASLIMTVVDATHAEAVTHITAVQSTLVNDLGITDVPTLMVLNKIDNLEVADTQLYDALVAEYDDSVSVSALNGTGIEELLHTVETMLSEQLVRIEIHIPYIAGKVIAQFHELAIVDKEIHESDYIVMAGRLHSKHLYIFEEYLGDTV